MKQHQGPVSRVTAPLKGLLHRFAYAGLVLTAVSVMMLGKADTELVEDIRARINDAFSPILAVMARPAASIADVVQEIESLVEVREENKRLREENSRLMHWQMVARKLEAENTQLRAMSNSVKEPGIGYVTSRVIADTGGSFARSLLLTSGERNGVRKGQAVVTGDGLVGRTAGVGSRSASVLLITDLNSRIPVIVENSRTRAILAGDNTDQPTLIHLPPGGRVSPGDRISTSGHGGAFPPGLPVGVVVSASENGIKVQPFVSPERLEFVRVVDYGLTGILRTKDASEDAEDAGILDSDKAR